VATTTGYGPRFLHSTGQLHKGGSDEGVFVQVTAPDNVDFPIPGQPYSWSVLKSAQALGDFRSLATRGRRALRVDLGKDVPAGLRQLRDIIKDVV
jgi:transaldolase/glucose-6-phosphate isomerase